ncbi:MAG: hypothetical protein OXI83_18290 [Gemmatimonadota bacterium]|nr:hypothetical protein [Gemmatimonadota bacterium]
MCGAPERCRAGPSRRLPGARVLACATLLFQGLWPASGQGQGAGFSGSYLNVWTRVGNSVLSPASGSGFHRLRVMWAGDAGPAALDFAYEHTLSLREPGVLGAQFFTAAAGTASGGDWLELGGDLKTVDGIEWRHRFDRLSARFNLGDNADLVIGRQPVSWATTLFLTPSDPFSPFDPADPFREYRVGVDAARLRYYRGAFTQFEVVARPARAGLDGARTMTLLGRATTNRGGWDLGVWGGLVHDTFGAAASLSGSVGLWALRAEAAVRDFDDRLVARGTVGLDRTFPIAGRDLYVVIEYQRDELGAESPDDLVAAATSRAFTQGEMQVLGRDTGALQLSWQLHPLVSASTLFLGSLRDGSFMFGPGLSYSVTQGASFRIGAFTGVGEDATLAGGILRFGSEYGSIPRFLYTSMNFFF